MLPIREAWMAAPRKQPNWLRADFGKRIRQLRLSKGLSQPSLARLANMDYKYLAALERGERNVTIRNIQRILDALDVDPGQLWSQKASKPSSTKNPEVAFLVTAAERLDKSSRKQLISLARHLLKHKPRS